MNIDESWIRASLAWLELTACTSDPQYPNCRNDQACQRDGRPDGARGCWRPVFARSLRTVTERKCTLCRRDEGG